ncbi:hypothetical protein [Modestobacter sp. SYSU DS0657]
MGELPYFRAGWVPAQDPPSPLPDFADEHALADWAGDRLSRWFVVEREVPGVHCSGRRFRVDAVIRPRDVTGWKDPQARFGVEFKLAGQRSFDTRNFTAWAAQAVDYTHVEWNGHGRLPLLVCPGLLSHLDVYGEHATELVARMLWQLGVGQLFPIEHYGWTILGQARHVLWSERAGVMEAARWNLHLRLGSR